MLEGTILFLYAGRNVLRNYKMSMDFPPRDTINIGLSLGFMFILETHYSYK